MAQHQMSFTAQSDPLILNFGSHFYKNHRDSYHRHYVTIKMRDLARVLLAMKSLNPLAMKAVDKNDEMVTLKESILNDRQKN